VLKPVQGKTSAHVDAGMTLRGLGEFIWSRMKSKSVQFVKDFNYVARASSSLIQGLINLIELQESLNEGDDAPVDSADVDEVFDMELFQEALKSVDNKEFAQNLKEDMDLLFHNLQSQASYAGTALELVETEEEMQLKIVRLRIEQHEARENVISAEADLHEIQERQKVMPGRKAALASSSLGRIEYIEAEIIRLKALLQKTVQEEQSYTYNMYGDHAYMWVNDVKLAKEKIVVCKQDLKDRELELSALQASDSLVWKVEDEMAKLSQQEVKFKGIVDDRQKRANEVLESAEKEIGTLREKAADLSSALDKILAGEDAVSTKHLLAGTKARNKFAKQSTKSEATLSGSDVFYDFKQIKVFINKFKKQKSLKKQKNVLEGLQNITKTTPIVQFVGASRLSTLLPSLSKEELLAIEPPAQALFDQYLQRHPEVPQIAGGNAAPCHSVQSFVVHPNFEEAFNYYDVNSDGFLSSSDMELHKFCEFTSMKERAETGIIEGDVDGDDKLNMHEFITMESKIVADALHAEGVRVASQAASIGDETHVEVMEDPMMELVVNTSCDKGMEEMNDMNDMNDMSQSASTIEVTITTGPPPLSSIIVDELQTFAAPGTANPRFKNHLHQSMQFSGKRWYTFQNIKSHWFWGSYRINDPVTWLTSHNLLSHAINFQHPMQSSVGVGIGPGEWVSHDASDNKYVPERNGQFGWDSSLNLHSITSYRDHLKAHRLVHPEEYSKAERALKAAEYAYLDPAAAKEKFTAAGMTHLASATTNNNSWLFTDKLDHAHLVTDGSGNCILSFMGTKYIRQVLQDACIRWKTFCGLPGVHRGFAIALQNIIDTVEFQDDVKPAIKAHCTHLEVTGHSLGGAKAELFAACANHKPQNGLVDWEFHKLFQF